jgi:hypothetical protein
VNDSNHARRRGWYLLLLAPFVGLLFPGWYATKTPELWGIPFFYWYQFAWVIVAALITWIVYMFTRAPDSEDHS